MMWIVTLIYGAMLSCGGLLTRKVLDRFRAPFALDQGCIILTLYNPGGQKRGTSSHGGRSTMQYLLAHPNEDDDIDVLM